MGLEDLSFEIWKHQEASVIFIALLVFIFFAGAFNGRAVMAMMSLIGGLSLTLMLSYGQDVEFKSLDLHEKLSYNGQICRKTGADSQTHMFYLDCADKKPRVPQCLISAITP